MNRTQSTKLYLNPQAGHYLCTIAAAGHPKLVKPLRRGIRHGSVILVNRQLLIANAFEGLIEKRAPRLHSVVRKYYDRVGIPLYRFIENAWLSDIVYILMKPAEYFFLVCLYCVEKNPEETIARQYSAVKAPNQSPEPPPSMVH